MYVRSERRVGRETDGWVVWYSGNDNDLDFFFLLSCSGLGWACSAFRVSKY
jgi:hypothetical protein